MPQEAAHAAKDLAQEQAQHLAQQRRIARAEETQAERERQHPLPHRHMRQHTVHEVGRGIAHPPGPARRAKASSATGERHEDAVLAGRAGDAGCAVGEDSAAEIAVELALHMTRQARGVGVVRGSGEALHVGCDNAIEHVLLRLAAGVQRGVGVVDASMVARHRASPVPTESLCILLFSRHARCRDVGKPDYALTPSTSAARPAVVELLAQGASCHRRAGQGVLAVAARNPDHGLDRASVRVSDHNPIVVDLLIGPPR